MKTKQEILDYLKDRKEYYQWQVNWCKDFISKLDINSINYKTYKWLITDYESRLDVIQDLLNAIFEKE